jgi:hypothetical protein
VACLFAQSPYVDAFAKLLSEIRPLLERSWRSVLHHQDHLHHVDYASRCWQTALILFAVIGVIMSAAAFVYRHNRNVHIGAVVIAVSSLLIAIVLIDFSWSTPYDEQYQSYLQWATIHSDLEVLHAHAILRKGDWKETPAASIELLERTKHRIRDIEGLNVDLDAIQTRTIDRQKHRWDALEHLDRDCALQYHVAILSGTAEMNRGYHRAIEHYWEWCDKTVLVSVAPLAVCGLVGALLAMFMHEKAWIHAITNVVAVFALIAAVIFTLWPTAAYASLHKGFRLRWQHLADATEAIAKRLQGAKSISDSERESMVDAVIDLIREKNDIDMSEPYPDFRMLPK